MHKINQTLNDIIIPSNELIQKSPDDITLHHRHTCMNAHTPHNQEYNND